MNSTNKQSLVSEIILLLKKDQPLSKLMKKYSDEDISLAMWVMTNEELVEIEEYFELN